MEGRSGRLGGGLAVALCLLTGCGGSSDKDYAAEARTICHDATAPLGGRAAGRDFGDLDEVAAKARDRYGTALRRFGGLEPPDARRTDHDALMQAARRLEGGFGRLAAAVERVDEDAALAELSRTKRDRLAFRRAAERLHLEVCTRGLETVVDAVLVPVYRTRLQTLELQLEVTRSVQRRGEVGAVDVAGDRLLDMELAFARIEPPLAVVPLHDRMIRAVSRLAQDIVADPGRAAVGPALSAVRRTQRALRRAPRPGEPS